MERSARPSESKELAGIGMHYVNRPNDKGRRRKHTGQARHINFNVYQRSQVRSVPPSGTATSDLPNTDLSPSRTTPPPTTTGKTMKTLYLLFRSSG
nr:uncharacterized protein LOC129380598 isoform X2 [Dermacentor andersoni]